VRSATPRRQGSFTRYTVTVQVPTICELPAVGYSAATAWMATPMASTPRHRRAHPAHQHLPRRLAAFENKTAESIREGQRRGANYA
jgi:hypothetical protein